MAIGSFTVRPEQVHTLSESIKTGANGIQQELETLDGKVQKLIGSWDGDAKEAYYAAQRDWDKKLTEIREILTKISSATDTIATQYTATDQKAAGYFG